MRSHIIRLDNILNYTYENTVLDIDKRQLGHEISVEQPSTGKLTAT